jgi:hypothetical protein
VIEGLKADGYARLRPFDGQGRLATYLAIVACADAYQRRGWSLRTVSSEAERPAAERAKTNDTLQDGFTAPL